MTTPHITPEIAAHVLHHFRRGGRPGSTSVRELLAEFDTANARHRLQLAKEFPGYDAAYELATHTDNGIALLQARANDDH
ncbi:hypothetical protein [Microbispora bryophytorum]|uniref:hypothetical protein n=1 Tax=Microbispora bryophytorum TaxID=1460882 RepID=UPI00340587E4